MSSEFWFPVLPLEKSLGASMRIGGMATLDQTVDLDQQLLEHTGVIDCLGYLRAYGKINWNHGGEPGDLLGDITAAEIRKSGTKKGLYIEAELNPNVKSARDAYRFMKGGGKLGFSVQGVTLRLSKGTTAEGHPFEKIDEAFISQVALTPEPKNYATFAAVLKSLGGRAITKAMTAGAGTDSAAFTGGRALTAESFGTRPMSTEQMAQLARHFQNIHGREADLEKSIPEFARNWQLTPAQAGGLAAFLGRKRHP